MKNLRALIADIIYEELGRSYKTTLPPDDAMFNWRKIPGVNVDISMDPAHNCWRVVIEDDDGNSSIKVFKDESEANFYAREFAMKKYRKMQSSKNFPTNSINYDPSSLKKVDKLK